MNAYFIIFHKRQYGSSYFRDLDETQANKKEILCRIKLTIAKTKLQLLTLYNHYNEPHVIHKSCFSVPQNFL